ncbi:hypothetical protein DY000_02016709 [Brassica cretica]|uniref:Retrotransposon gag domain-containing protein n=1 Tax=Brassica cretica TaxID=69181 RepID=A0ABQ7CYJ1_BRACR|nr:hypothetical protein DY000_02016709 [Brassica cretica]
MVDFRSGSHAQLHRSAPRGGGSASRGGSSTSSWSRISAVSPTGPSQGLPHRMTIKELVRQLGRESLPFLDPYMQITNSTWFGESGNGITKSFLRMEYNTLDHGYPTYFDLPDAECELWFHQFAQEFNWDSLLTTKEEIAFTKAVAHHYSGCISDWKQKWERNEEPKNINHTVWEGLIENWQKPETKSLSETTSGNWKSDRGGKKDICPQLGSD